MIFVDTNYFLRYLRADIPKQYEEAKDLFLKAATGEEIERLWGYFPPDSFRQTVTGYLAGVGTLPALEKELAKEPENIGLMMQVAEKYASRSRFEKAVALYEKVVAKDPENKSGKVPTALSGIGDALYRDDKFMEAREPYQTIVEKYPNAEEYNDALEMVPYLYEQSGDTATAVTLYRQLLIDHPNYPDKDWVEKRIAKLTAPVKGSDK